jgi:hypothetical protein
MPETVFACTHIEKCAEVDVYDDGVDPKTRVCTICQSCDIQAPTLPELLKAIGEAWYNKDGDEPTGRN